MVDVVKPWTKWAYEIRRAADIPTITRRAIQIAMSPPRGPVFLSFPLDVQFEEVPGPDLSPPTMLDPRVRPATSSLVQAASILTGAKKPVILAGSRVTEDDAISELVELAEMLGAQVMVESGTSRGRLPFPTDHPLQGNELSLWSPDVHQALSEHDVVIFIGIDVLRQYIFMEPACPIPKQCRLVHIDNRQEALGKNYPIETGVFGHLKVSLAELSSILEPMLTSERKIQSRQSIAIHTGRRNQQREQLREKVSVQTGASPMTPLVMMEALSRVLPPNVAVVEEAVTTTRRVFETLGVLRDPKGYFAHRGWALGWGLGTAIGVKLAWPDRPVLCLLGEGASLYGIQGLWTAAHYNIPVTFVICNNAQYQILKDCSVKLPLPKMHQGQFMAMDITEPEVDFVGLARSFGVEAHRITTPGELAARVSESFRGTKPILFDVPISRD
jgi:benzoylformate decarboxylase